MTGGCIGGSLGGLVSIVKFIMGLGGLGEAACKTILGCLADMLGALIAVAIVNIMPLLAPAYLCIASAASTLLNAGVGKLCNPCHPDINWKCALLSAGLSCLASALGGGLLEWGFGGMIIGGLGNIVLRSACESQVTSNWKTE